MYSLIILSSATLSIVSYFLAQYSLYTFIPEYMYCITAVGEQCHSTLFIAVVLARWRKGSLIAAGSLAHYRHEALEIFHFICSAINFLNVCILVCVFSTSLTIKPAALP
jgi:hypothetical protein